MNSATKQKVAVSVVVLTMNERQNIDRCLNSVEWADDVVVVDSGSTDGTVEKAQALGARVLSRPFDNFAAQRNYALSEGDLRHEWVLHLDADEVVDQDLHAEIVGIVTSNPKDKDAWHVPFKLMFMERWLRYAALYPSYQVRLGHRERLRFKMVGHGQREDLSEDRVSLLKGHLVHYNFSKGVAEWFVKHARYARAEAEQIVSMREPFDVASLLSGDALTRRRSLKALAQVLPFRPVARFVYMYVVRGGFLDGRAGFNYCLMIMIYQMMIDVNQRDMQAKQILRRPS